jgi:hypothetical protein
LREYELSRAGDASEQYTAKLGQCPKVRQLEWCEECRKLLCANLNEHYLAQRPRLLPHLKPRLPSSVEQAQLVVEFKKVAPVLFGLDGVGRAAVRLQAPTLATCPAGPRPTGEPRCALCRQQPDSPVHLLHHCRGPARRHARSPNARTLRRRGPSRGVT